MILFGPMVDVLYEKLCEEVPYKFVQCKPGTSSLESSRPLPWLLFNLPLQYITVILGGGDVTERFSALDMKSVGPGLKSLSLPLSGFSLGGTELNSTAFYQFW